MISRPTSPLPPIGQLTTGHYRMRERYSRWRPEGAPGWHLICTVAGRGRLGYSGGELMVGPSDVILLAPRVPHDYGIEQTRKHWELLWAYFFPRTEWHGLLNWPEVAPGLQRLKVDDAAVLRRIVRRFAEMNRLNNGSLPRHEMHGMNALEKCLLECDALNPRSQDSHLDPRILRALELLRVNLSTPLRLPDLAKKCGFSTSRLAHLFREQINLTPQRYFELKRMGRACQLLELTRSPVAEVAEQLGFNDEFYFSHRFKKTLGVSPREYRQRLSKSLSIPWIVFPGSNKAE